MTEAVGEILSRIDGLSQQERAELAYAFICSLEPGEEEGVAEAWDAELSSRVAEIRSGRVVGKPSEQLFDELRGRRR
ncbi:MAG: addiction module protein [Candidatus Sumerlaeota bacterium]|nr:addiction module protein [Candidatus Sumerlaeota bacterium]